MSLPRSLSTRDSIHLCVLVLPGEEEVIIQATGTALCDESNASREHKVSCISPKIHGKSQKNEAN